MSCVICQDPYLLLHLSPPRWVNGYYQIVWTKKRNSGAMPVMGSVHHIEPHITWEILKQSFISTIRPTIHSTLSRKRSSSKTLLKLEKFENAGFVFSCDGNILKTGLFQNDGVTRTMWFLWVSFPQTKWLVIVAFLNSPDVIRMENLWCIFRVKPPFSNSSGVGWMVPESDLYARGGTPRKIW